MYVYTLIIAQKQKFGRDTLTQNECCMTHVIQKSAMYPSWCIRLHPRSIDADTMLGPYVLTEMRDVIALPEVCRRYLVEYEKVLEHVGIGLILLAGLVIPVQRAIPRVHHGRLLLVNVVAADKTVEIVDTSSNEDVLHTVVDLNLREYVAEFTRMWVAGREPGIKVHTATEFTGMVGSVTLIHREFIKRPGVPIL